MSSYLFLLACVCCVRAIPLIPRYSSYGPGTAALAFSRAIPALIPRNSLYGPGTSALAFYNMRNPYAPQFGSAGPTLAQSGSSGLSGTNRNFDLQTPYYQQASQATSGADSNSGINFHQGANTHQGYNRGPSNYNGPLSGYSSPVAAPRKQAVLVQGARSAAGSSGDIYVAGD